MVQRLSISYTVTATVDGNQIKEQTVNGTVDGNLKADVIEIPTTGIALGSHKIKFAITKVDGAAPTGNTANDVYESDITYMKQRFKDKSSL